MVYKEILLIGIISLVLFSVGLVKNVSACSLTCKYYYKDLGCTQSTYACGWMWDAGGCQIGFPAGELYEIISIPPFVGVCIGPEEKWLTLGGKDGGECVINWGWYCDHEIKGKWDESEKKCVNLWFSGTESSAWRCVGTEGKYVADMTKCESAVGAGDGPGDTLIDENPINNCIVAGITVPGDKLLKGESFTIKVKFSGTDSPYENVAIKRRDQTSADRCNNYQQLVCTYGTEDIGLKAPSTAGTYTYDIYCSGSSSSSCAVSGGVKQTFTIDVKGCFVDSDCGTTPNKDTGLLPYCDSPEGKTKNTINPSYSCQSPTRCNTNDDCVGTGNIRRCCVDATDDPNAPKTGSGKCVDKGILPSTETPTTGKPASAYLCDPGVWVKCNSDNIGNVQFFDGKSYKCISLDGEYQWEETSSQYPNLFLLILDFFKSLFKI